MVIFVITFLKREGEEKGGGGVHSFPGLPVN
jgi:hypothetical protein